MDLFDNYKNYKDYETQNIFLKFIKNSIYYFIFLIYYPIHFHIAILYILLEIIKIRRNIIIKDFFFGYFFYSKDISKSIYNSPNYFHKIVLLFINYLFFIIFYPIHFHVTLLYRLIEYIYYI